MNVAIITGASSGMGKWFAAYSRVFFPDIEEIWLIGRNLKRLSKVSDSLHSDSLIFAIDLSRDEDIAGFEALLKKRQPNIKLLVNSAGMGIVGDFKKLSTADCTNIIRLNCEALTNVTRLALDYMGRDSRIINLSSSAAFVPQAGFAVYAATKSYVLSFSRALNRELKDSGIYVTAVCPGTVNTPFLTTATRYEPIKPYKRFFMAQEKSVVIAALWDSKRKKAKSIYGIWMKAFRILCKFVPVRVLLMFMK